jgi:hypothetical protein
VEVLLTKTGRELEQKAVSIPGHIATCLLSSDRDEQGEKYAELREMLDQTLERLKRTRKEREAGK